MRWSQSWHVLNMCFLSCFTDVFFQGNNASYFKIAYYYFVFSLKCSIFLILIPNSRFCVCWKETDSGLVTQKWKIERFLYDVIQFSRKGQFQKMFWTIFLQKSHICEPLMLVWSLIVVYCCSLSIDLARKLQ